MKIQAFSSQTRSRWLRKPFLSGAYRHWLVDEGSLTKRLQARYADFAVQPTKVAYDKALLDEAPLLCSAACKQALIREVMLCGGARPVVFAHSVLPRASLHGAWLGLSRIGNKPLGGALFANPRVVRTPLSFKKLARNHALYISATRHLEYKPACVWARRSVFRLNRAAIMVTEVFLPEVLHG